MPWFEVASTRSSPEQKPRPAPVRTMTRTESSASSSIIRFES